MMFFLCNKEFFMKFNAKIVGILVASTLALAGCKNEQNNKVEANNTQTATQASSTASDTFVPTKDYQYTVLKTPITNAPKVMEVFSLACSHCRKMESLVPELKKMIGENITQYHVTFNESAQAAAVLFYTAAIQSDDHPTFKQMEALFSFVQDTPKEWTPEQSKTKHDSIYTEMK
jgi:thiol-disulfide isomerase/thioredoxin